MKIKSTHELSREYHKLLNREIKQTNSLSTEAIKEIRKQRSGLIFVLPENCWESVESVCSIIALIEKEPIPEVRSAMVGNAITGFSWNRVSDEAFSRCLLDSQKWLSLLTHPWAKSKYLERKARITNCDETTKMEMMATSHWFVQDMLLEKYLDRLTPGDLSRLASDGDGDEIKEKAKAILKSRYG